MAVWDRPRTLLVRNSSANSQMSALLFHVIVVNVEHHMLPQLSLSRDLCASRFYSQLQINCQSAESDLT
jgi:hypothetical protein